jgi:glutaminyl-tRNA synthetase
VRLYDRLFLKGNPDDVPDDADFMDNVNPNSLQTLTACRVEPSLTRAVPGDRFQFERQGYFCMDPGSTPGAPVFNRTIGLRDTWAKIEQAG